MRAAYGIIQLENQKQILNRAIDNIKQRCIEGKVDNHLLPMKDRLYGSNVMGWKLKENSSDNTCPYYTMHVPNFIKHLKAIQENKSKQNLSRYGIENSSNRTDRLV